MPAYSDITFLNAIGDSHVLNYAYDVRQTNFFPGVLTRNLTDIVETTIYDRNYGIDGDTTSASTAGGTWTSPTAGMLDRINVMTRHGVPKMAVIYGTTNDYTAVATGGTITSQPAATTATVANLVTRPNLIAIATSLFNSGVEKIIIAGYHLRNFAVGGDVTAGVINPEPSLEVDPGAVFAASTRWAQYQAYLALAASFPAVDGVPRVAWCDFYAWLANYLNTEEPSKIGVDTYYHVATGNTHLNDTGESLLADALLETIQAQNGWIESL